MNEMNYSYDTEFEGNILIVDRTGCEKTTFVQNLGKTKMFWEIKEIIWVPKIQLSKDRGNNIREFFADKEMDFKYPNNIHELLEYFQMQKAPCNEKLLGKNIKRDRLIIIDDVSGLAGKSETFANFLTVSRKFGLTCIYIFHTIYPTRQEWQMILVQTKIFNIFPGSIQTSSVVKILSNISYYGINKEGFYNGNFIFDFYSFVT